jgi:hypothetical protein
MIYTRNGESARARAAEHRPLARSTERARSSASSTPLRLNAAVWSFLHEARDPIEQPPLRDAWSSAFRDEVVPDPDDRLDRGTALVLERAAPDGFVLFEHLAVEFTA